MEVLIEDQNSTGQQLLKIITNYGKDSEARKSKNYLEKKKNEINELYNKFRKNDNDIINADLDKNLPYFEERKQIQRACESILGDINKRLINIPTPTKEVMPLSTIDQLSTEGIVPTISEKPQIRGKGDDLSKSEQQHLFIQPPVFNIPTASNNPTERLLQRQIIKINHLESLIQHANTLLIQQKPKQYLSQKIIQLNAAMVKVDELNEDILLESAEGDLRSHAYFENNMYYAISQQVEECTAQLQQAIVEEENQNVATKQQQTKLKLPQIQIPQFYGDYNKWIPFHDLFKKLIHENKELLNTHKMSYLKAHIAGSAAKIISHLDVIGDNYNTAWNILESRFNNKRLLVSNHVNTILSLQVHSESAHAIKTLHDTLTECLHGISNLGIDTTTWNAIIIPIISKKLDSETLRLYESSLKNPKDIQSMEEFLDFLEKRFQSLEALGTAKIFQRTNRTPNTKVHETKVNALYKSDGKRDRCILCQNEHNIIRCPKFYKLSILERLQIANLHELCRCCLARGHTINKCLSNISCNECRGKHHSLLHNKNIEQQPISIKSTNHSKSLNSCLPIPDEQDQILLATAVVEAQADNGKREFLRILIDPGSQATFITEDAVQRLRLKSKNIQATIAGVGDTEIGQAKKIVSLTISSQTTPSFHLQIEALVFKKLTKVLPEHTFCNSNWKHLNDLKYADPNFNKPSSIDILLGADYYPKIVLGDVKKGSHKEPVAQKTELGWIVFGRINDPTKITKHVKSMISYLDIENQLKAFWEIEEIQPERTLTAEEQECEKHYANTHKRLENGRYEIALPFKPINNLSLGESKRKAMARFLQIEEQFKRNPILKIEYNKFMDEYLQLNHMELVDDQLEQRDLAQKYYLPHHAVIKAESTTTKLRVVFDASAKSSTGVSLNDIMTSGPTLQQELIAILTRWRKHKYAFKADIEKMFRQINVREEDQHFQRVLWRNKMNQIKTYKLKTVTYGTTSATYLATKTLQQLAHDENEKYPLGSRITIEDFYVDDVLSGGNSLAEVVSAQDQLINLLKEGGFNLRKWSSNNPQLLYNISEEDIEKGIHTIEFGDVVKTLGIIWNTNQDEFQFKTNFSQETAKPTKRRILSEISKLFDPLGWLAPIIVTGKILIQQLWISGVDWDQELDTNTTTKWESYKQKLSIVEEIRIPRWIEYSNNKPGELHGFCDASEEAYSAVIYFKSTHNNVDKASVTILMAKTRVAPIKTKISLPRLELCAAVLLARLITKVQKAMQIPELVIYAWTDSMITLGWIRGKPHKFKTFVANRISEIQGILSPCQWRYVKSEENPADCATRGLNAEQLKKFQLWWKGPEWLSTTHQPTQPQTADPEEEQRVEITTLTMTAERNYFLEIIERYSTLTKTVRVIAYIIRYIRKIRKCDTSSQKFLTKKELNEATTEILKIVQNSAFSQEKKQLMNNQRITVSQFSTLNPFLDRNGVIRVGGRLANTNLDYDCKHPVIIPHKSHLTQLLIDHAHRTTLHGGKTLTLAYIRQRYWIIKGSMAVKTRINRCITCHKHSGRTMQQIMGHLPQSRVTPTRPFMHTGIDYAGPIQLRMSKGRGCKSYKGYLSIFVCLVVKAVHIEVVSDMTAEAFIAAFKRFKARRGQCSDIYSDCGTNFVGADKMMQRNLVKAIQETNKNISENLANDGIQWHFIPPAAPHMGGIWESAVKSTKYHLKRIIGEQTLTYEELTTVTNQIEACLNSRPLCAMNSDPNDFTILTPGHFLTGGPIIVPPEPSLLNENINYLTRWNLVRRITQDFWKIWLTEYVLLLQRRNKWKHKQPNIAIGELVLVKDNNIPPGKWPLARVYEVYPGIDDHTRVVNLKGADGSLFKRPITKISPLPTEDNEELRKSLQEDKLKTSSESQHNLKRNLRNRKTTLTKTIYAPIIILTTMISVCISAAIPPIPYNITKFENEPGIYFENFGDLRFTNNNWNIIVYYNLSSYYKEFEVYRHYVDNMNKYCSSATANDSTSSNVSGKTRNNICALINLQFQQTFVEMEHRDELLHNKKVKFGRSKRGAVNIIGNIISDLFGVLDDRDAARYEQEIEKLKNREDYLLALIKNQTSIIDATANIFNKREENIDQFWQIFKGQIAAVLDFSDGNTNLLALSVHTLMLMISFKETQDTLIEAVLDTHNQIINTRLLTTSQLKNELDIMIRNMPSELMLPQVEDIDDILGIYQIMSSKTKLNGNYLIFELKIPLVYKEQYQIYKPIPLPTSNNPSVFIEPQMEFLVTNLHRDTYYTMSAYEFQKCMRNNDFYICKLVQAVYQNQEKDSLCELQLLRQGTVNNKCQIVKRQASNTPDRWIQLQDHRWLYSVQEEHLISIVCYEKPFSTKLSNTGILSLGSGCTLKERFINIPARQTFYRSVQASFLPIFNLSNNPVFEIQARPSSYDLQELPRFEGIDELRQKIKNEMLDEESTLSFHHMHHYSFAYGFLIIVIIIAIYIGIRRYRNGATTRTSGRDVAAITPLAELQGDS